MRRFCAKLKNNFRGGKYGPKQNTNSGKYMEVQQLRQYRGGNQTAGGVSCLQTEMRISERDVLSARLRLYGNGQPAEADEIKFYSSSNSKVLTTLFFLTDAINLNYFQKTCADYNQ